GLPSLTPGDALQIYYCAIAEGLQRNSKLLAEFEAVVARVGDKDAELVALTLARSHIPAPPFQLFRREAAQLSASLSFKLCLRHGPMEERQPVLDLSMETWKMCFGNLSPIASRTSTSDLPTRSLAAREPGRK